MDSGDWIAGACYSRVIGTPGSDSGGSHSATPAEPER